MIIDGFEFRDLRPSDFVDTYAVTIIVNGAEIKTELVTSLAALWDRISDINRIILAGDEILLQIRAPKRLKHLDGKYIKNGGSDNAKENRETI